MRIASKNEKLLELNAKIAPAREGKKDEGTTMNVRGSVTERSEEGKPQPLLPSATPILKYCPWNSPILPAPMFPTLPPQAIVHHIRNMVVGGVSVGSEFHAPMGMVAVEDLVRRRGRPPGTIGIPQSCARCYDYDGDHLYECPGKGKLGRKGCIYYPIDLPMDERRKRPRKGKK